MKKKVLFGLNAKEEIYKGAKKATEIMSQTLGPCGFCVCIASKDLKDRSTKDGATVAKNIERLDVGNDVSSVGVRLIVEASKKIADKVGDGSTTVVILLESLMSSALDLIRSGANVNDILSGLHLLSKYTSQYVQEITKIINVDSEILYQTALISSNGDEKIAKTLTDLFKKFGKDVVISLEISKTGETYVDACEGFVFNRGYTSQAFLTQEEAEKAIIELQDAYILVSNEKINTLPPLLPLFQQIAQSGKPLIIVAPEFDTKILEVLVVNRQRGLLNIVCVKAYGIGDRQTTFLEDLAINCNAELVAGINGLELNNVKIEHLGVIQKIKISSERTIIIGGKGDTNTIQQRISLVQLQLEDKTKKLSSYEHEKLSERLAMLTGVVVVLYVGGKTDASALEAKDRAEDALKACLASLKFGVVPGAGTEFLHALCKIQLTKDNLKDEIKRILNILANKSLNMPFKTLVSNTQKVSEDVALEKVMSHIMKGETYGFNGVTGEFCNVCHEGIYNPSSVGIEAINMATAMTEDFVKMSAVVYEETDDNKKNNTMNDYDY